MMPGIPSPMGGTYLSIAIFAWNEEGVIARSLRSLFEQTLFHELAARALGVEVLCVLNGCTDRTADVAEQVFATLPPAGVRCGVCNIAERGKLNAWNQFVHRLSAPEAQFLICMDADIQIHLRETLWSMVELLRTVEQADISVDRPRKDLAFKDRKTWRDRLSLAAAENTKVAPAQLCAQLYCIRAEVARRIWLPRHLPACEDGFIKTLVCTQFLTQELQPWRIQIAPQAEHTFEAYTKLSELVRNQKRQALGQTVVHLLLDKYLPGLPEPARNDLCHTLRRLEETDPNWLQRLTREHLEHVRFFWRLYPCAINQRLSRWRNLKGTARLLGLPSALAGTFLSGWGNILAWTALKRGCTNYWPRAARPAFPAARPQSSSS